MLRSYNKLIGFSIHATDGEIGKIHEFLYDEQNWIVRYAEVDIGKLVPGKYILLSSSVLGPSALSAIGSDLTIEQIINCPAIEHDCIPTRKYEEQLHNYFSWAYYWAEQSGVTEYQSATRLRQLRKIKGLHIKAKDGDVGHISDLLIDDLQWVVRYYVVDIGFLWPGRKVLVSADWTNTVDHEIARVSVDVTSEKLKGAPEFDLSTPVTSEYETELFEHYDKKPYWEM